MAKSLDAVFKRIVQEHNVAYRHNAIVSLRNDVSDQEVSAAYENLEESGK